MELRNIKSFIKVAEFENFSKAAEVLGYAQSTITLQIQQLEQELGVNLFDRIGKRVLLSEKGRAFLSYANDMVQLEAEAIETVSENTTPTGTLRIGTIESIASSFLPLLLEEYLKKCPQVHLDIIIGVTLELYDQLEKGNLDIIFLADRPAYHPTLKTVFSRPVAVPFIASAEHPLANQKNVPPERLTEETILLTEKNNNYRQIFDELAIQHGASFHHMQEISSFAIILHFLQKKMGISFLPKYATLPILQEKNLALFTVAGFDIKMDLLIFYHRQKWVTPAMKYFTETAEEFFSPSAESET